MLNTILLPLDRSVLAECVLPHAVALATALHARLTVLHVLQTPCPSDSHEPVDALQWRLQRAEVETYLQDVQSRLEAAGVVVDAEIVDGDAAEEITKYAQEKQVDLIIMSSHGASGLSGWNLSSIAQKVVLRAHTSMMIVRAYRPVPPEPTGMRYARLLAPLDGSPRAESALPFVADLARAYHSQVLLTCVVARPELPGRMPPTAEDTELVERMVARNRAAGQIYLEDIRGRLDDVDVEVRLLIADQVEAALHGLAEQEQTDLVLLTAHGHSGDAGWPYGSVVLSFLAYGFAPLLIVQDLHAEQVRPTHAELALRQMGRR